VLAGGNPAISTETLSFFLTADMADTSKWQRLPAEFDKNLESQL
jgi:hypothetical protein